MRPAMSTRIRTDPAELADKLHSAAIHLLRKLRREDESSGLNAPRLSALSVLVFGGPMTLGELAAAEQVRPPTMTRIVTGLEQGGLARRMADPRDARRVRICASAKGARLLQSGRKRRIEYLARHLEVLEHNELEALRKGVHILEKVLSQWG